MEPLLGCASFSDNCLHIYIPILSEACPYLDLLIDVMSGLLYVNSCT